MPTYCYSDKDGNDVREFQFPFGKAPKFVAIYFPPVKSEYGYSKRVKYTRDFQAENVSVPPKRGWPMTCFASGVHPDQAGQLRAHFKKAGADVDVNGDGDPTYKSAAHRKKALACRGMNDRSSFS